MSFGAEGGGVVPALDNPPWAKPQGGYKVPYDAAAPLRRR